MIMSKKSLIKKQKNNLKSNIKNEYKLNKEKYKWHKNCFIHSIKNTKMRGNTNEKN